MFNFSFTGKQLLIFIIISTFNIYNAQENNRVIKLSLEKGIEIVLQHNPEIISASKEIDASVGRILQAGRLQNSELSIEVNEIPNIYEFGNAGELDINFNQPIEFFGKRSNRIQSAEIQKRIAELNYERIKKLITAQFKKVYYNGLLSNQIVESIEANINLLNDFLAQVTDRYQTGTSTYLDVIRAKVEIARLKNELFDARKNFQQVIAQLKILLGNENGTEFILTDSLNYNFSEINKDSIIEFYSSQSNFLKIAELQVLQNKSSLTIAQKNALPDFNFGLSFQNRQSDLYRKSNQYLGLNIGISLPMFYSSGVRGDIIEAEANLSISEIRYQYIKTRIMQNIKTALNNFLFAEEQLRLFDSSLLRDIEDELRAGITAYQNNQIDLLNLFDIYRTYRATKVEYSRTIYNTLVALVELETAGEKWNTDLNNLLNDAD
ncbi:TolC family protein [Rosettibacter firmus]|uniref:TolC family protein n=1 Tax=Rosettibacter firmus TaxID=3111522 RepID=UPI00336BF933